MYNSLQLRHPHYGVKCYKYISVKTQFVQLHICKYIRYNRMVSEAIVNIEILHLLIFSVYQTNKT